jgi:hypothetical protein
MRALVDRHHHALFYSLQLLFDRLGVEVYTPIGHDWWDEGYWRFGEGYGDDRLAAQFLNEAPFDNGGPGALFLGHTYDGHHPDRPIHGVPLSTARDLPWDYVVATVQDNQAGFRRFADEVGAKYVLQVGNTNQHVDWTLDPLALVSSEVPIRGRGVVYHQEIDTAVFAYREPDPESRTIRSFVNCFNSTPCQRPFDEVRGLLPEFTFASHGIDGPDGNVETVVDIADLMAGSAFGWHDKVQGDGFGHVIHDWAAIGRPLIGHGAHYRGLMGEGFWQDMVTCIDLDKHPVAEAASIVRDIVADRERHLAMCRAIRAEFDCIDYDAEAERIRELLS